MGQSERLGSLHIYFRKICIVRSCCALYLPTSLSYAYYPSGITTWSPPPIDLTNSLSNSHCSLPHNESTTRIWPSISPHPMLPRPVLKALNSPAVGIRPSIGSLEGALKTPERSGDDWIPPILYAYAAGWRKRRLRFCGK